jgi:hypothetical protein
MTKLRTADFGLRIGNETSIATTLALIFRNPQSTIRILEPS